jgi:hypothetical protein
MPTLLRVGPFRFFFFSRENGEPPHVHVERDDSYAKFWLEPDVTLAGSSGFRSHEITELHKIVEEHRLTFVRRWNEYFPR